MTVLLTRRAVVRGAMETTYNVAASLTNNDGILCADPQFTADPQILTRNFTRDTLSPQSVIAGRLTAKMDFETEFRSNGTTNTGLLANAPIISRLFRASGYQLIPNTSPSVLGPFDIDSHTNPVTWALGSGAFATGTVTFSTAAPAANDTVTVNGQVYTFKTALTGAAYEVLSGANFTEAATNFKAAINKESGEGLTYGQGTPANIYVAASQATGVITLTADRAGTSGNSISLAKSGTNIAVSGANLSGGTNQLTTSDVIAYYLTVTTGGASGAAQIAVSSDTAGEAVAATTVTSGAAFTIGTKGLTLKPTFTGSLVLGQRWVIWATPAGLLLKPVSDNQESMTLEMFKDRKRHLMAGAFGTFTIDATAGEFSKIQWSFQGTYAAATDSALPSPTYERTLPSIVELARLRTDSFNAIVNKFSFDQSNQIEIRPDVSSAQGYIGSRITGRTPTGGIDPEDDLVSSFDFWDKLSKATRMPFQMRIGKDVGNTVWMFAPSAQYNKMTYTDRNGIQAYDAGLAFAGYSGDDEMMFFFC